MILIFASFAIAPLSIVLVIVILTPSFVMQAGQPYDITVSLIGQPIPDQRFTPPHILMNESNFTSPGMGMGVSIEEIQTAPGMQKVIVIKEEGSLQAGYNSTEIMLNNSKVKLEYLPANHFPVKTFSGPSPRFMYVGDVGHFGRQTDVTFLIVATVIISAALATTWLVLGLKEYKFFSKWNQRYSNYKRLQENLDKDLEE
jgi:hypothetical protein